jgi:UDP-3-O-[3-hydroxymyristoyl] glucosamine N-acyltransferase
MADARFFANSGPFTVAELASSLGAEIAGAPAAGRLIRDLALLDDAAESDVALFADRRYRESLDRSAASAIITSAELVRNIEAGSHSWLIVPSPRAAFAAAARLFHPEPVRAAAISERASIAADAVIGADCRIEAGAVIEAGASVGARCHVAANAVIGPGVRLDDDCSVGANASISHALIGKRVTLFAGARIGTP